MRPSAAGQTSSHHCGDRRHPSAAAAAANRQEWIPRGSAIPIPPESQTLPGAASDPSRNRNPRSRPRHPRRPQRDPPPAADPPPALATTPAASGATVPQLVQEIQDKLSRGAVECMICYDMVRRSAAIWSCSSCFSIFHLHCIRKWARSPTSAADASAAAAAATDWRCPGCQSMQLLRPNDISYFCFCGSQRDPPNDLFLTPHSCGEPCGKPLKRDLSLAAEEDVGGIEPCPHVCVLQCHPGPCPPCKAFAPRRPCPCGKKTVVRRCSDRKNPPSCGLVCNRLLSCGRHRCELICHTGACSPCRTLISASCFCKKKTQSIICGDILVKGDVQEGCGIFSCDEVCGRRLSCGNHHCKEDCHAGPCGDCELSPEKIRSCHCGKTPLTEERRSCLDQIPCCSMVCDKLLPCGVHRCRAACHEGDCPPCLVRVEQKCRCRSSARMVECYKMCDEKDVFACEKVCGKKKGCGRHRCSDRCCTLSRAGAQLSIGDWDPHLCSFPCGKRLQCGQHSCQLLCHSGHCPPCMETIFADLSCACGKTSMPPPLPCGTQVPSCPHPCMMPQQCGHPAVHSCHFGDCPPCTVPVAKECNGGHVLLRNIPCGSKDIRCNQLCGQTRQCGMHACARACHPPPCDSSSSSSTALGGARPSCGQLCGAPRRDCKHTCTSTCHPSSPCPDLRCDLPVTIACSCGRISATVPCSAGGSGSSALNTDVVFEASIIQKLPAPLQPVEANGKKVPPLGQRKLACDEECAKLERKRVLAEAFDVTPPNLEALHFGENATASDLISDLLRRDQKWVLAVEERFKFMVLGKTKGSALKVHVFCHMMKEKGDAVREIAERWKLSVHAAGWEPKRFLVVHVTQKSRPPVRILGSKPGMPTSTMPHRPPVFDPLIDMDPRLVVSMLDLPGDADISVLVLRFGGECELVWLNDKNALAVFGDPARAATALRRLDNGSVYSGAVVVLPNSGVAGHSGSNAWATGPKEGGSVAKLGSSWKKAVAPESDSCGGVHLAAADSAAAVWKGNEAAPISALDNRWNILESEALVANRVAASSAEEGGNVVREEDGGGSGARVAGEQEMAKEEEAVEDWEEAFN